MQLLLRASPPSSWPRHTDGTIRVRMSNSYVTLTLRASAATGRVFLPTAKRCAPSLLLPQRRIRPQNCVSSVHCLHGRGYSTLTISMPATRRPLATISAACQPCCERANSPDDIRMGRAARGIPAIRTPGNCCFSVPLNPSASRSGRRIARRLRRRPGTACWIPRTSSPTGCSGWPLQKVEQTAVRKLLFDRAHRFRDPVGVHNQYVAGMQRARAALEGGVRVNAQQKCPRVLPGTRNRRRNCRTRGCAAADVVETRLPVRRPGKPSS